MRGLGECRGDASPVRGYTGPGCGRGGASAAEWLGAGRALRHHLVPSPWVPPRWVPPRSALVLPSGPPWQQDQLVPARPASPAASSSPQAAFAAAGSQWPAEPSPPLPRPPSALHHWPQRAGAPPAQQAGKCSPAQGSPRAGTSPLPPHPTPPRAWYVPGDLGIW